MLPSGIHGTPVGRKSNLKTRDDKVVASHRGRDETRLRWDVELRGREEKKKKKGDKSEEGEKVTYCAFRR